MPAPRQANRLAVPHGLSLLAIGAVTILSAPAARAQLAPEAELKTLRAAPGMQVALFASEPLVTNPAAIDVDTHGRVWVAEIQWYRGGAKNPPADTIKVLEDTNGDGRADRATVFADGVFAPMSICVAGTRVFVATSPDLWMYEDADGDLRADGPPKKLLTGFGGYNHDHGAHSLVLGPDHKWWMSHGDAGFDVQGTDGSRIESRWGAVIRGELDGSRLERVAANFRNPYEVCVSSFGEAYLSDNDNDGNESARICWVLEGGDYGWFGGPPFDKQQLDARLSRDTPFREQWHFRGYVPGYVPATLMTGFGSPTGICFYEGDAFGAAYKNVPLHTDAGPRECRAFRHEPAGFGMHAAKDVFLSNQGDDYFRPDDICAAPDGRLYVSDWYDGGVGGHGYNNPDQGRIFVLAPRDRPLERREKPGPYENVPEAIAGLQSPNLATQFLARERLLTAGQASAGPLVQLLSHEEPNYRARALWVLDRLGGAARHAVEEQLKSPAATFRALAVRILRRHGDQFADAILALADDPSAEVRREVLLAAGDIQSQAALDTIARMAATYDGTDRFQLEAIHVAAAGRQEAVLARLEQQRPLTPAQFPLLQVLAPKRASSSLLVQLAGGRLDEQSVRKLLASAVNIPAVDAGWGLLALAQDPSRPVSLRRGALEKVLANVPARGPWSAMSSDEKFAEAIGGLLDDDALRPLALRATGALRLAPLAPRAVELARAPGLDPQTRAQAVRVAARLRPPGIADVLRQLLTDPEPLVQMAALAGVAEAPDVKCVREILASDRFDADLRGRITARLIDSTAGALVLLRLIDERQLPSELEHSIVQRAVEHPDANVRQLFAKFLPEDQRPRTLGAAVTAEEILALVGDANRGRVIFFQSSAAQCKACHAVNGFGAATGPELTHIGRKYERKALLETILEPSKAIAPEYVPYVLQTTTGQVYAGFLVEHTAERVVLKDINNHTVRVAADEIEQLARQQKSLMPELVLRDVTAQDAADLLEFLTTLK
jgi:putative membrane-bound dehydrogenase-like protein